MARMLLTFESAYELSMAEKAVFRDRKAVDYIKSLKWHVI